MRAIRSLNSCFVINVLYQCPKLTTRETINARSNVDPKILASLETLVNHTNVLMASGAAMSIVLLKGPEAVRERPELRELTEVFDRKLYQNSDFENARKVIALLEQGPALGADGISGIEEILRHAASHHRIQLLRSIGGYLSRHSNEVARELRLAAGHVARNDSSDWVRREASDVMHIQRASLGGMGGGGTQPVRQWIASMEAEVWLESIEKQECTAHHLCIPEGCRNAGEIASFRIFRYTKLERNMDHRDAMLATSIGPVVTIRLRDLLGHAVVDRDMEQEIRLIEPGERIPLWWDLESVATEGIPSSIGYDRPITRLGNWRGAPSYKGDF